MTSSDSSIPDDVEGSPCSSNWRKAKQCSLCDEALSRRKKHGCKFCLRAVCEVCSPNRKVNSRTGKTERICVSCEETELEDEREFRRACASGDILAETEEKLKLETALRQSVESKYAVTEATRDRKAKELEKALERAEDAEKKAEELALRLEGEREKGREMKAFWGEIAEMALGRPMEGQEIGEEIAKEVLRNLKSISSLSPFNQPAKLSQIASCESVEIASKPIRRVPKPNSVLKTVEIASISAEIPNICQLSLDSTSLSLPAVSPPHDETTETIRKSHPSVPVQSRFQADKICSSAPEPILPCAHCEELTKEVSRLRRDLEQLQRSSRIAGKTAQSTQACQCVIT